MKNDQGKRSNFRGLLSFGPSKARAENPRRKEGKPRTLGADTVIGHFRRLWTTFFGFAKALYAFHSGIFSSLCT